MLYARNRSTTRCPHCGQAMRPKRLGVEMYPKTAAVFDAIHHAGPAGIDGDDLYRMLWPDGSADRTVVKAQVSHIRDALVETDYTIVCDSRRHYRLARVGHHDQDRAESLHAAVHKSVVAVRRPYRPSD